MDNKLFVMTFERNGDFVACRDIEVRICSATSMKNALDIAKKYHDRYYSLWSYNVRSVEWNTEDDTAYIGSYYLGN